MSSLTCVFCGHGNPAGAKYCNECAAPLHLKPCPKCEAVNDRSAILCYKCGDALLTADPSLAEAERPSEAVIEEPAVGQDEHVQLQSSPEALREGQRHADRTGVPALTSPVAFFERSLGETAQRFPTPRPLAAPMEIRPVVASRLSPLRVGLLTVVVSGAALLGYLAYRFPMEPGANGVPAQAVSSDRAGTIRVTPLASEVDAPLRKPLASTAIATIKPTNEAADHAAADDPADYATASPHAAAAAAGPAGSANAAATLSPSVPSADIPQAHAKTRVLALPSPRRAVAAPSTTRAPPPSPESARFAVAPPVSSGRNDASADRPPRACTEQVAALGLCSPRPNGEGT